MIAMIEPLLILLTGLAGVLASRQAIEGTLAIAALGGATGDEAAVRIAAEEAGYWYLGGVAALAIARALSGLRPGRHIHTPLLLPAVVGATALGLCVQLGYGDPYSARWTGPEFGVGAFLAGLTGALVLLFPADLPKLFHRGRYVLAGVVVLSFVALALFGTGPRGSGTRINLGPVQPIEAVKVAAVLFLANYLGDRSGKLRFQRVRFLGLLFPRPVLLVPALAALLGTFAGLFLVKDLGPTLILAGVFLGLFFLVTRASGWLVAAGAMLAGALLLFGAWPELAPASSVQLRLRMWTDPWLNGYPNGDQLVAALWTFAAGGLHGVGFGASWPGALPAGHTDLVYAHLTEELGLIGAGLYLLLLGVAVTDGLRVAYHNRTPERVLMAAGLALLMVSQAAVILGGTLGLIPLTGVVVPFLSYGKTSLITFVAVAALIARLGEDAHARARTDDLDELRVGVKATWGVAVGLGLLALAATASRTIHQRDETSLRYAVTTLAEGQPRLLSDPRIAATARAIRRGSLLDRNGEVLSESLEAGSRLYPLGDGLGTLLGPADGGLLRARWSLERSFEEKLRGFPDLDTGPTVWLGSIPETAGPRERVIAVFSPETELAGQEVEARRRYSRRGGSGDLRRITLSAPDHRSLLPLARLDPQARKAALAVLSDDVASRSVSLTLDARLQRALAVKVREAAEKSSVGAAAVVVLDPATGQVLARAQWPDYDPGEKAWRKLRLADDPKFMGIYGAWSDKTGAHGIYQAGSVFKVLTALVAVRQGLVSAPSSDTCSTRAEPSFECNEVSGGRTSFSLPGWGKPIHDFGDGGARGDVDLVAGMSRSSNVYFGQLALALGPEPFRKIREEGAEFGNPALLAERETEYTGIGTANSRRLAQTGFGQGAGSWNVAQAARLVSAVASSGVYRRCSPDMELGAACEATPLLPPGTSLGPVLAGMEGVMRTGTGAKLPKIAGLRMYGKTGTADAPGTADEAAWKIKPGQETRPHSWFVVIAEPAEALACADSTAGRYVVAAVVPHGGFGASAAGPLAFHALRELQSLAYLPASPTSSTGRK